MITGPSIEEILAAVSQWLESGADDASGFQGKVAANALAIVRRELRDWPAAEQRAIGRLEAITGATGSFEDLEARLCTLLREGAVPAHDARVMAHLRATARDRLAVDQPAYRSLLSDS